MHARPGPRCRLIGSHAEYALCRLYLVASAPPRNEGTGERSVKKIDRDRVVEYPAHSRRRHRPAICTAILIEPSGPPEGGGPSLAAGGWHAHGLCSYRR